MSTPKVTRRINVSLKQLVEAGLIKTGQVIRSVDLEATVQSDGDISYVKNGKSIITKSLKQFAAAGRGWTWCPSREIIISDYQLYKEREPEDIQLRDLFEVYAEKMGIQILPRKDARKVVEERKVPMCLVPPPGVTPPARPKAKPTPPRKAKPSKATKKQGKTSSATVVCQEVDAGALAKPTSVPQPAKEPSLSSGSCSNLQAAPKPAKARQAVREPSGQSRAKSNHDDDDDEDDEDEEDEDEDDDYDDEETDEESSEEEPEPDSDPAPASPPPTAAPRVAKDELSDEKPAQVVAFVPKRVKSSLRLKVESVYPGLASLEMHLGEEELERLWVQWESESKKHIPKAPKKREAQKQNHTKGPGRKKPSRGCDPEDEPPRKRIMVEAGKGKNAGFSPKSASDWGLEEESQQDETSEPSSPRLTPVKGLSEANGSPPTSPFSDPSSDPAGNCPSDYGFSPISPPEEPAESVVPHFPMPEGFEIVLDIPPPCDLWAAALSYGKFSAPLRMGDPGRAPLVH